MPLLTNKKTV